MKKCTKCGVGKELSEFYTTKDSWCKDCKNKLSKQWKADNKDRCNANSLAWQKNNREKYNASQRRARHKRIEKNRAYQKEWSRKKAERIGCRHEQLRRNGELAKQLKEKECEKCGTTKTLVIHHKDNQGRNNMKRGLKPNNNPDNLMILCNSCHMTLHAKDRKRKTNGQIEG